MPALPGKKNGSSDGSIEDRVIAAIENSPDCPSCESGSSEHEALLGPDAPRGDGVYCAACGAYICAFFP